MRTDTPTTLPALLTLAPLTSQPHARTTHDRTARAPCTAHVARAPLTHGSITTAHHSRPIPYPRTTQGNAPHVTLTLSRSRSEGKACTPILNRSHARLRPHSPPSYSDTHPSHHHRAQTSTTTTTRTPRHSRTLRPQNTPLPLTRTHPQGKQKHQYNGTIIPTI